MYLASLLLLNASSTQAVLIPHTVSQLLSELAFSGMSALHLLDWYRETREAKHRKLLRATKVPRKHKVH